MGFTLPTYRRGNRNGQCYPQEGGGAGLARREKVDRGLNVRLDELERRLRLLKINYDKYFMGIDLIEPMKERDDLKRFVRELTQVFIKSTAQKYRYRTLKARSESLDQYIQRNLLQIERGTHPKMKFRANLAERRQGEMGARLAERQEARADQRNREDAAFRRVFDSYMNARESAGMSSDMSFDSVRDRLRKQVREVKSRYQCKSVIFRVVSEDGKVKLKAVPKKE